MSLKTHDSKRNAPVRTHSRGMGQVRWIRSCQVRHNRVYNIFIFYIAKGLSICWQGCYSYLSVFKLGLRVIIFLHVECRPSSCSIPSALSIHTRGWYSTFAGWIFINSFLSCFEIWSYRYRYCCLLLRWMQKGIPLFYFYFETMVFIFFKSFEVDPVTGSNASFWHINYIDTYSF